MADSKYSPKIAKARVRELRALELRMQGLKYYEIGAEMGLTESGARKCVKRAMDRNRDKLAETVKEHVEIDLGRIEELLSVFYPAALGGSLKAVDRVNTLLARKAKLMGLDAPERIKFGGDSDEPLVIEVNWPENEKPWE